MEKLNEAINTESTREEGPSFAGIGYLGWIHSDSTYLQNWGTLLFEKKVTIPITKINTKL